MAKTFDETELLERVDNDVSFLAEAVEMLTSDGKALLAELRQAVSAGDASGVGRVSHALKGMISSFCAPGPQECALKLERLGKAGDLSAAAAALQELETQMEQLAAELQTFVQARA